MKRFYCTYFDKNYLVRALALIESLHHHERNDFVLYAVCMDELSRAMLEQLALKNVIPVPFHQIEYGDAPLMSTKATRSLVEYYWTSTPTIILYLIEHYPEIEVLTYLDADLFFFSTPDPIFHELGQQSILLYEHRFSSSTMHLAVNNGKYNVGLLCFRNDTHGIHALRWWRERCLEWCFARYEDGKLGDQMYLNDWPTRFPQVVELQHVGGGVGPWNHDQYIIRENESGEALVNDLPIIFYHFHALRFVNPEIIVPVEHLHYPMNLLVLQVCYLPYILALSRGIQTLKAILPEFECGLRSEGNISPGHILWAKARFAEALKAKSLPQVPIRMNAEWNCYCPEETPGITELVNGSVSEAARQPHAEGGLMHENVTGPLMSSPNSPMGIQNQYELFRILQENSLLEKIQALYIIGAHVFQEREMLLSLLPHLQHIYLFEPIPDCLKYLRRYEAQDSRIRVFPYALSQTNGTADFFLTDNQGESSSLLPMGTHREIFPEVHHVHTIKVETRTLESVIRECHLAKPDMLFLDVQGAEYQILSSLSEDLLSQIHLIYAEASLEELYQGSKTLQDLRTVLDPYFDFLGYAPMSDQTPTHGNALFANRGEVQASKGATSMISDNTEPLVSVIVSTYNSLEFIRECLEDLERQTVIGHMEIIVVDAASQQHERTVIEEFQERFGNIVYIRTSTKNTVYAAWNLAIRASRGKYITPFSTNDRLRKDAYEILMRALEEHLDIPLVYGDTYITQVPHETFENHTRYSQWKWPEYSFEDLLHNCRVGPHPMWRRNIHETIGYFDEQYQALGDQDFWLRMGEQFQLLHVSEFTGLYWVTSEGLSNRKEIANPEESQIREKYLLRHQGKEVKAAGGKYDCSIIIPVFNQVDSTKQCLLQLSKVTQGCHYEVIIVDNHSTDGSAQFFETLSGDIQIIRNEENLGFAKACNQGARLAKGKHLVFLNNDTIPKSGWLDPLLHEVDAHDDVAVVGSKLLYQDNTIQHAGVVISRFDRTPYHLFMGVHENFPAVNVRRELQAVTAACMLVRKEVFEKVGGFDEGFEDVDLCLKIRQLDKKVIYQPKSCVYHLESQTVGRKTHDDANIKRFLARWEHQWLVDEDLLAYQSGYIIQQSVYEETFQSRLIPISEVANFPAWQRVVDLQQLLLGRECQPLAQMVDSQKIRDLLVDVEPWPNDIGILEWLGRVCATLECEQEAIKFWEKLLTIEEHPNARLGLARFSLQDGHLDEAQQHLDVLTQKFPQQVEGWMLQGVLCMQHQDFLKAKHAFEAALSLDGLHKKARLGRGMACMGLGESAEAWTVFGKILKSHPDDIEVMNHVIQAGTALECWDELAKTLVRFLERNPANVDMRFALAGVTFRAGQLEQAQQQLALLRLVTPDFEGLEDLTALLENAPTQSMMVATG